MSDRQEPAGRDTAGSDASAVELAAELLDSHARSAAHWAEQLAAGRVTAGDVASTWQDYSDVLLAAVLVELRRTNELLGRINSSGAYLAHAAFDARRALDAVLPVARARLAAALRSRRVRNLIGDVDS
jgi:hypothetical protein